jgi:hypothetical protein
MVRMASDLWAALLGECGRYHRVTQGRQLNSSERWQPIGRRTLRIDSGARRPARPLANPAGAKQAVVPRRGVTY